MTPAHMGFVVVEPRTLVLVIDRHTPSAEAWQAYMEASKAVVDRGEQQIRALVVSAGGGPDSLQRAALTEIIEGVDGSRSAVVTSSFVARGIVTAISWFNSDIKSFPPERIREALHYLELDEAAQRATLSEVQRIRAELGLEPLGEVAVLLGGGS